jgi:hypothetical protein
VKVGHSPPFCPDVNTAIPLYVIMALSLSKQRDKFTFALTLVFHGIKFNYFFAKIIFF